MTDSSKSSSSSPSSLSSLSSSSSSLSLSNGPTIADMELSRVDDQYIARMTGFEVDCNEGRGEPAACHSVGDFLSVVMNDHNRAFQTFTYNCDVNNFASSCFNLGRLYSAGKGVAQSDNEAEKRYKKACDGGHIPACYHLGILMYLTNDINKNSNNRSNNELLTKRQLNALNILDKNCDAGDVESCYFTGSHNIRKDNMNRNPKKAESQFLYSCGRNHVASCKNLAVMYNHGDTNVPKDNEKFEKFKEVTLNLVKQYGSIGGKRVA